MITPDTRSQIRKLAGAVLVAGAVLLLSACSTTTSASRPSDDKLASDSPSAEKAVSYKELHSMMTRLADESVLGAAIASTTSPAHAAESGVLATNP
jgi:hypothetical protein